MADYASLIRPTGCPQVVPAKAGTHNPGALLSREAAPRQRRPVVMGPGSRFRLPGTTSEFLDTAFVGWAKRSVPTKWRTINPKVGTAQLRLCPPYATPSCTPIESASSCQGCTDQWPDAAPEGEASTNTVGKSSSGGCRPSATALVGFP